MATKIKMEFNGKLKNQLTFLSTNYEFRFDVVASEYNYRKINKKSLPITDWDIYDDDVMNSILLELECMDLSMPNAKLNMYVENKDIAQRYDPFLEYFQNLKSYNPKKDKDYIALLSETVKTDDQEFFLIALRKFLVGSVACLLDEDQVNDVCLVLQSMKQGLGKTRWMRKLLPYQFQKKYFYEGAIDTKNKDHNMYLSQFWFINLDELEGYKTQDVNAIKSFITRDRISERASYARHKSRYIRRASFLGSVNDEKFLVDITGGRRWLPFNALFIDYMHTIDIDMLWSQVYHLYNEGFQYWFNNNEIEHLNKRNESFREMNQEEEMVLQYFSFPKEVDHSNVDNTFMGSAELIQHIISYGTVMGQKLSTPKVGKVLSKYSSITKKINGISKYYVCKSEVLSDSVKYSEINKQPVEADDELPF